MAAVVSQWTELLVNTFVTPFVPLLSTAVTVTNMDNSAATCYSDITGAATLGSNVVNTDAAGNLTLFLNPVGGDGTSRYKLTPSGLGTFTIMVAPRDSDLPHRSSGPFTVDFTSPRFGGISGSDWSTAINLALGVLGTAGTLTAPNGSYNISLNHKILDGVNLQFGGGGTAAGGVKFVCTASGAGFSFGDITTARSGGLSCGFTVDGATVASIPIFIGLDAYRTFVSVRATRATDAGMVLQGTQNSTFINCITDTCTNDGLRVDRAASNAFINHESYSNGRYNINIMSGGSGLPGTVDYPLNNVWYGGRAELHVSTTLAMIHQGAGLNNTFSDFNCATSATPTTAALDLVKLEKAGTPFSSNLTFRDSQFVHNFTAAATNCFNIGDGCALRCMGTNGITSSNTAIRHSNTITTVSEFDHLVLTAVTNLLSGPAAQDAYMRIRPNISAPIAGSTISGLTKAMSLYDTAGNLMGYVPLYTTWT